MSVFQYSALDAEGKQRQGSIDAVTLDLAITALQRRGLVISKIDEAHEAGNSGVSSRVGFFDRITNGTS